MEERIIIPRGPQLSKRKPNEFEIRDGVVYVQIRHKLRPNSVMLVDEADWPAIQALGTICSYTMVTGDYAYAIVNETIDGLQKQRQVLIARFLFPDARPDQQVDHWNHNTLDNRRSNLRLASISENSINRKAVHIRNSSGFRGVRFNPRTRNWNARLRIDRRSVWIGAFSTAEEAGAAVIAYLNGRDYDSSSAAVHHE